MNDLLDMGDKAITRPPRCEYDMNDAYRSVWVGHQRSSVPTPVTFPNSRGLNVVGSYFTGDPDCEKHCCVIYLHGNASCQLEGRFLVPKMVPAGVSVFCFDFSGCGNSQGERVSLGYFERDDVACAISYLQVNYHIERFFLWGRSMGAATALLSLGSEHKIDGVIVDSPFSSLSQLIKELSSQMGIPGCFGGAAVWILASRIESSSGFDIRKVNPIEAARQSTVPIRFIHGENDDFIICQHSRDIYSEYMGDNKEVWIVPGDHNTDRPDETMKSSYEFVYSCFNIEIGDISNQFTEQTSRMHFKNVESMLK